MLTNLIFCHWQVGVKIFMGICFTNHMVKF
jgi:hypothetical protein